MALGKFWSLEKSSDYRYIRLLSWKDWGGVVIKLDGILTGKKLRLQCLSGSKGKKLPGKEVGEFLPFWEFCHILVDHVFLKVSIYMIFLFFFNLKVYTIYVYHSFLFPISSLPPDSFSCVPPFFLFRKQTGNKKIYQNKKIEQKHKK